MSNILFFDIRKQLKNIKTAPHKNTFIAPLFDLEIMSKIQPKVDVFSTHFTISQYRESCVILEESITYPVGPFGKTKFFVISSPITILQRCQTGPLSLSHQSQSTALSTIYSEYLGFFLQMLRQSSGLLRKNVLTFRKRNIHYFFYCNV